jgi:phosphoserine phosphatase
MDRTLLRVHSGSLFVRHQRRKGQATLRDSVQVAYWLLQYTFGVIDAERAAEQTLIAFKGREERWLLDECIDLFETLMRVEIADAARRAVDEHRARTPVAINPDARLRRIARKRGWRIERW